MTRPTLASLPCQFKLICVFGITIQLALPESILSADERPNILFCMADDWGWPHAGAYGDQGVKTPNFDKIADEGILFHHVYVSSPSCTPSRNAVITGKYHWQLGPGANLWSTLPAEHESFVHMLRDSGYVTGRSPAKTWGPGSIESWAKVHGDHPVTGMHRDLARFLDATKPGKKPFFFWLATSDPHRGYKLGSGKQSGIDPARAHLFEHYPDVPEVRSDVADYYFEVQRWDSMVGKALRTLAERGLSKNTIVIMTGDHGMPFPRCKGNLYDSGVRVPFALRWPSSVTAHREIDDFISFADIAPTLLEATGTKRSNAMTGRSFAGLLSGTDSGILAAARRPDIVFGRERHVPAQEKPNMGGYPSRGLRTRNLLYIRNYRPGLWPAGTGDSELANFPGQWYADCDASPTKDYIFEHRDLDEKHRQAFELCFGKRPAEELYDLRQDPGQIHNLASDAAQSEALAKMRQRLRQRLSDLHDPRAKDPSYAEFDQHPYLGGKGGARKKRKN